MKDGQTEWAVCWHSTLMALLILRGTRQPCSPGSCRVDSDSAEGIPDPSPAPEAGLPAQGRLHFPAIPGNSENPWLWQPPPQVFPPPQPAWELGAGLWWPNQQTQLQEPGALLLPPLLTCREDRETSRCRPAMPAPPSRPEVPSHPLPDLCWGWTPLARCNQYLSLHLLPLCGLLLPDTHSLDPGLAQGPADSGALMPHSSLSWEATTRVGGKQQGQTWAQVSPAGQKARAHYGPSTALAPAVDGLSSAACPLHSAWHQAASAEWDWGDSAGTEAAPGHWRGAGGSWPEGQFCRDGGQPEGQVRSGLLRGDDRGQPPTDGKVVRLALPFFLHEQSENRLGMQHAGSC